MRSVQDITSLFIVALIAAGGCSYSPKNPGSPTANVSNSQTYKLGISTNNNEYYTSMAYEKNMGKLEIIFWDLSDKLATNLQHKFIRGILLYPDFTVEHLIFTNPTSVFIEGHYLPSDAQNKGQLQDGILYVQKTFLINLSTFSVWIWIPIKEKNYMLHYFYDDGYPSENLKQIAITQLTEK
ncbi:hypothetical protein KQH27_00255 [bacterium]|nr:hypothetical protein [bacterium]